MMERWRRTTKWAVPTAQGGDAWPVTGRGRRCVRRVQFLAVSIGTRGAGSRRASRGWPTRCPRTGDRGYGVPASQLRLR